MPRSGRRAAWTSNRRRHGRGSWHPCGRSLPVVATGFALTSNPSAMRTRLPCAARRARRARPGCARGRRRTPGLGGAGRAASGKSLDDGGGRRALVLVVAKLSAPGRLPRRPGRADDLRHSAVEPERVHRVRARRVEHRPHRGTAPGPATAVDATGTNMAASGITETTGLHACLDTPRHNRSFVAPDRPSTS